MLDQCDLVYCSPSNGKLSSSISPAVPAGWTGGFWSLDWVLRSVLLEEAILLLRWRYSAASKSGWEEFWGDGEGTLQGDVLSETALELSICNTVLLDLCTERKTYVPTHSFRKFHGECEEEAVILAFQRTIARSILGGLEWAEFYFWMGKFCVLPSVWPISSSPKKLSHVQFPDMHWEPRFQTPLTFSISSRVQGNDYKIA